MYVHIYIVAIKGWQYFNWGSASLHFKTRCTPTASQKPAVGVLLVYSNHFRKYVCVYLSTYVCPYTPTLAKPLSGKSSQ